LTKSCPFCSHKKPINPKILGSISLRFENLDEFIPISYDEINVTEANLNTLKPILDTWALTLNPTYLVNDVKFSEYIKLTYFDPETKKFVNLFIPKNENESNKKILFQGYDNGRDQYSSSIVYISVILFIKVV
jgi:hypothetical protein